MNRTLKKAILSNSKSFPVIMLTGPRQVGKTFLLEALKDESCKYISLDDIDERNLAVNNPKLFIQKYEPPVIIDEVQYAPELFTYIKIYVDTNKKNGLFYLTGSQKFGLMKGVQESLAGRVAIFDMLGFSQKEMQNKAEESTPFLPDLTINSENDNSRTINDIYEKIWLGSFPRIVINGAESRDVFYKSYIQTYIERDVKYDLNIHNNEIKFYNFIRAAAVRTGNLLNYADIARDVDIDVRTAKLWLNTLERSGLVKLLEPYFVNIAKRMVKTPKIYFLDTGLCSYLAQINTPQALEASYLNGNILETFAFIEILKSYWHNGKEPYIFYYQNHDKKEVDFVIETNGTLFPMEVKKTASPSKDDIKNFHLLKALKKPIGTGALICLRSSALPIDENNVAVPIWDL